MKNKKWLWITSIFGFIAIVAIIGLGFTACGDGENNSIPVTGVTSDKTSLELTVRDSITLVADIAPPDATNTNVTWSTSDANVAYENRKELVNSINILNSPTTQKERSHE